MKIFTHSVRVFLHSLISFGKLRLAIMVARLKGRRPCVIVLTERMGDLVACQPVAGHCKTPKTHVIWICASSFVPLVRLFPGVDVIVPVVCLAEASRIIRQISREYIIDLRVHGKECPQCRKAVLKQGESAKVTTENYYLYGSLLDAFTHSAGVTINNKRPTINYNPELASLIQKKFGLKNRYIVIHCASEEFSRNWQDSCWHRLVEDILQQYDFQIVEIGNSSRLKKVKGVIDCCGQVMVNEAVGIIKNAFFFIGIDSGPAHIANAACVHGVILLGKYRSFERYLPYTGFYAEDCKGIVMQYWREVMYLPYELVKEQINEALTDTLKNTGGGRHGPIYIGRPRHDLLHNALDRIYRCRLDANARGFTCSSAKVNDDENAHVFCYVHDLSYKIDVACITETIRKNRSNFITVDGRPLVIIIASISDNIILGKIRERIGIGFERSLLITPVFKTITILENERCQGNDSKHPHVAIKNEPSPEQTPGYHRQGLRPDDSGRHPSPQYCAVRNKDNQITFHIRGGASSSKNIEKGVTFFPMHPQIDGHIDVIKKLNDGSIILQGWCVLPSLPRRPADRLFVCNANPDGMVTMLHEITDYRDERPDVALHFNDKYVWFSGWHTKITGRDYCKNQLAIVAMDTYLCETYILRQY